MRHALRITTAAGVVVAFATFLAVVRPSVGGADAPGAWGTETGAPGARQEVSYVRVTDRLYLAGGCCDLSYSSYDPDSGGWAPETQALKSVDHVQGAAVGGRILYVGGLRTDGFTWPNGERGTVEIYDPATKALTLGAPMPAGRERGAGGVAAHEGRIYYAGGLHGGGAVKWVDRYDPVTDTWTAMDDMPTARDHFQAVVFDGKLHVIGGRRGPVGSITGDHDALDLATGTWETNLPPLPTPRGGYGATRLGDEIVVIGGETDGHVFDEVEAYAPATRTWRSLAPLPEPRHGIQAATCSGAVYVAAGGYIAGWGPTGDHQRLTLGEPEPACVNAPPACAGGRLATDPGQAVAGRLACTDADRDELAFAIVDPPDHGQLQGPDAAGRFTYAPAPGFRGQDSFTYRAADGDRSPLATVNAGVGEAPDPVSATGGVALPARLARRPARLVVGRHGNATLRLRCPAQPRRCTGRVRLVTVRRFRGARVRLASRAFSVAPGRTARVRLPVTTAGRRLLARRRRVAATLVVAPQGFRAQRVRVIVRRAR